MDKHAPRPAIAGLIAALLGVGSCKTSSLSPPPVGAGEKTGTPTVASTANALGADPTLVSMTLGVDVYVLGLQFCSGTAHAKLNINTDPNSKAYQLLQLPNSLLDCGIQKVDLSKLLSGLQGTQPPPTVAQPVYITSDVIHLRVLGNDLYSPGRPLLPAILTADPAALKTIKYGLDIGMTDTVANHTATGHVDVATTNYQAQVQFAPMSRSFANVYDFQVTNTGFDGVDKLNHFLFTTMAVKMSLQPIALLELDLTTKVSDILSVIKSTNTATATDTGTATATSPLGDLVGGIGSLIGKLIDVRIVATLQQMDGLDSSSSTGVGEVINGKPTGN